MPVSPHDYLADRPDLPPDDASLGGLHPFELEMLTIVKRDWELAKQYRRPRVEKVQDHWGQYRNASHFEELRAKKEFPVPLAQQLIDQFVAQLGDKMFFANRACRIIPQEKKDTKAADAKQAFMDWQDFEDDIRSKLTSAVRDCGTKRFACAQVDYYEKKYRPWVEVDNPITGGKTLVRQEAVKFAGARVTLVDPQDVYFGPDKREMADPFSIMVYTRQSRDYFRTTADTPYFRHHNLIVKHDGKAMSSAEEANLKLLGEEVEQTTQQQHDYVEWQGLVNRKKLYSYARKVDPESVQGIDINEIDDDELTWAIVGVVDLQVPVRLQENEHGTEGPNLVVGCIEKGRSIFDSVSLMDKIYPICRAADQAVGQLQFNIKSNINRAWAMNTSGLENKSPVVNDAGFIIETSEDPNKVVMSLDQLPLTEPLQGLLAMYYQMAKDATMLQSITLGQGDKDAETLGEASMTESHAVLGINDYLKCFEETFIQPLYAMRDRVNEEMIDEEFRYRVIGDKAVDWQVMTPVMIRTNVDFICESASRETNRAVKTQQLLKAIEVGKIINDPIKLVRLDLMLKQVLEAGMTLSQDVIEELLPLLKYEQEMGVDVGKLIAEGALLQMGVQTAMLAQGGMGGGGGVDTSQPVTETGVVQGANAANQPNVNQIG
jgi:hypothetical protein